MQKTKNLILTLPKKLQEAEFISDKDLYKLEPVILEPEERDKYVKHYGGIWKDDYKHIS